MKISYRTHPALRILEEKKLVQYSSIIFPTFDEYQSRFAEICHTFNPIKVFSSSFAEAVFNSVGKLFDANIHLVTDFKESGTIMYKGIYGHFKGVKTFFYNIDISEGIKKYVEFFFLIDDCLLAYDNTDQGKDGFCHEHLIQKGRTAAQELVNIFNDFYEFLLFQKFAQIEIKHLSSGQKEKSIDCKYINETKTNVQFLNSTWFTTLVKSDAFKVRGHFRLQPCGEGLKDRKLIWISDFMKDGYTAPARKLKEYPAES